MSLATSSSAAKRSSPPTRCCRRVRGRRRRTETGDWWLVVCERPPTTNHQPPTTLRHGHLPHTQLHRGRGGVVDVEEEGVATGRGDVEEIELERQIHRHRIQPRGHLRKAHLSTRPSDLLARRIGHQHLDLVWPARFLSREENPRHEGDARECERNRRDLQIVEDADERGTAVVAEDDLVAERDILDVHEISWFVSGEDYRRAAGER